MSNIQTQTPMTSGLNHPIIVNTKLGPRAPELVSPKDKRIRLKNFAPYDQDQIRKAMGLYVVNLLIYDAFDDSKGYRLTSSAWEIVMGRNQNAGERPIVLTPDIVTLVDSL
jgi:hypothetical protein